MAGCRSITASPTPNMPRAIWSSPAWATSCPSRPIARPTTWPRCISPSSSLPARYFASRPAADDQAERQRPRDLAELPRLFGDKVSWADLASRVARGAEVRVARLHEDHDFAAYRRDHDDRLLALFCLDARGHVRVASDRAELDPQPGESVICLVDPTPHRHSDARVTNGSMARRAEPT